MLRPVASLQLNKKRLLTEKQLEYYANLSDSESDEIFGEKEESQRCGKSKTEKRGLFGSGPVTVCKWRDKQEVLTSSNMHVEMIEMSNHKGKLSMKPNIIQDYNQGIFSIDRSDQMLSYY
ncbi:hypothetical protein HZH68_015466 [Vespula germanica]|uniref:PiggyBac transposable element-derived protein domain-containing protein n=1 Tax=Vespula germanica TaxID=30212 RepID=A0A834MRD5_VESGE|nr:hypothetical protein HZH68_015466 [Vespula germanica]